MSQQNWHNITDYAPEQPQQQWKIDKKSLPWYLRKRALIPAFALTLLFGLALPGGGTETATEGLTEDQVQQIVDDALADQPEVETLSRDEVQGLIDDAVAAPEEGAVEDEQAEEPTEESAEESEGSEGGDGPTVEQENAVQSAQSYLDFMGFSRTGLIEQLEYEGYSTADATYAVDNIDVDWMEQAARVAQEYVDFSSYSRAGLIDQLIYDGFTPEQAEHGADSVGL